MYRRPTNCRPTGRWLGPTMPGQIDCGQMQRSPQADEDRVAEVGVALVRLPPRADREHRVAVRECHLEANPAGGGEVERLLQAQARDPGQVLDMPPQALMQDRIMGAIFRQEGGPRLTAHDGFLGVVQAIELRWRVPALDADAGPGESLGSAVEGRERSGPGPLAVGRTTDDHTQFLCRPQGQRLAVEQVIGIGDQREVSCRATVPADGIQRAGIDLDALGADDVVGRLHGIDAAIGRRANRRAAGLGPEGQWNHEIGDGSARAARRATRSAIQRQRVASQRMTAAGRELDGVGLAEDDGARRAQQRDATSVTRRLVPGIDRRVVAGRQVGRVDDVLDADRQTMERAPRRLLIPLARGGDRLAWIEHMGPGAHLGVAKGDPLEARAHQRLRREPSLRDLPCGLSGGQSTRFHATLRPGLIGDRQPEPCRWWRARPGVSGSLAITPLGARVHLTSARGHRL